jgi:transcriptional antiterminator RfaH
MPLLTREPDIYPDNLFEQLLEEESERRWWALYTMSRQEKGLMRRLLAHRIPFYSPVVARRTKSPAGRVRTSYVPLFSNYVFLYGDVDERYTALTTNCVSKTFEVTDGAQLARELRQFHDLIAMDAPLTPEAQLEPGHRVRVRKGRFQGLEGVVIRREGEIRLLIAVNFIQQGASLLVDDCDLEAIV